MCVGLIDAVLIVVCVGLIDAVLIVVCVGLIDAVLIVQGLVDTEVQLTKVRCLSPVAEVNHYQKKPKVIQKKRSKQ